MVDSAKKNNGFIPFISILITYIIVKIVYKLTGFHYGFDEGIVNIKLLMDLALWGLIYFTISFLVKSMFHQKTI